MTTKEQGIYGESKVLAKFIELGVPVSIPFGDNCPYDFVADFGNKLNKIQVKTSSQSKGGGTYFRVCRMRVNNSKNTIKPYAPNEVDYYALYSLVRDKIYLIKFDDANTNNITIRYEKSKNNQDHLMRFEEDYLIDNVLKNISH